nr:protein IFH1-like isoform X2 [Nomia melanderi]
MSGAPARGTAPRRQRRHHHHHHHQKHQKQQQPREEEPADQSEEKRPKVNPIFLWASQREQRIVEVRCEDYDKRNRIKLTKTAQGWRSIPRTASNMYSTGLGVTFQKASNNANPSNTSDTSDEKEVGKQTGHVATGLQAKELTNGRTNGLVATNAVGRKRNYDEINRNEHRRDYGFPLDNSRNNGRVTWDEERRRVPCSDDDEKEDEDDEEDEDEDEDEDDDDEEDEEEEDEEDENEEEAEDENRFEKDPTSGHGRSKLERLQKDKLLQPRVVLEQLHFSQLPEGVHQNVLQSQGNDEKGRNEDDVIAAEKKAVSADCDKRRHVNKAGIQDILNMIDATASPVLATDTPSADLPVDSTKTYEVLNENLHAKSFDGKIKDSNSILLELSSKINEQSRTNGISSYQHDNADKINENLVDDKIEIHEEKILGNCESEEEKNRQLKEDVIIVSIKNNSDSKLCKVVEADGGLDSRSKCRTNSRAKYQNMMSMYDDAPSEVEEERPDEPGEPIKIDYNDSSKILNALRNTPGLSVSITKTHTPESSKVNNAVQSTRPTSKASSSSRSPDSQAECAERMLKSADSAMETQRIASSSKNLPGLSIIIPSYRYRNPHAVASHSASPNMKARVESPESTVNFTKTEAYPDESKLDGFPHEEDHDERDMEEDEDDCDSQVLEDLRRQKADSLAYESDRDYFHRQGMGNSEDRRTPLESSKNQAHWISSTRNSEAQAKCKYQDVEHFDEQVLEELRTRGTVVSPQPSGIPCSPASRRPSSAYLERLLPSPPCSVSCSEDAKNDITLKGILSSPNQLEARDFEKQKEMLNRCDQVPAEHHVVRLEQSKDVERTNVRKRGRHFQDRSSDRQEIRSSSRPLSSGDIHSTYYVTDRVATKRPMSAEWSVNRQKSQFSPYQKFPGKHRVQTLEEACATSSSTDKLLDPASQLRELIETSGHLIPEPLLVPRDYLPGLAAAPATEIPKLLATRPELRLPEALDRPDLVRDPDLLVISLAHLQHVLDHGEGPVSRSRSSHPRINNGANKGTGHASNGTRNASQTRPKLSCKPIGTLMPAPIDLSSSRRSSPYPPLLRVRSGLLKQEPEVSSTANSPDDSQLWHPLFGRGERSRE